VLSESSMLLYLGKNQRQNDGVNCMLGTDYREGVAAEIQTVSYTC
jgi:hypothetical protein